MAVIGLAMIATSYLLPWLHHRQRARAHTFMGSKTYRTTWLRGGVEDGTYSDTIASFMMDANGRRFCILDHANNAAGRHAAEDHDTLRLHRHRWERLGLLPDGLVTPGTPEQPSAQLIVFPGGKDDGAA
jgi:hypothetical protein